MSHWNPCKRRDFIKKIRNLGFEGPFSGSRHQFMIFGQHRLTVPSNDEYSIPQVRMMIREIEVITGERINSETWATL